MFRDVFGGQWTTLWTMDNPVDKRQPCGQNLSMVDKICPQWTKSVHGGQNLSVVDKNVHVKPEKKNVFGMRMKQYGYVSKVDTRPREDRKKVSKRIYIKKQYIS